MNEKITKKGQKNFNFEKSLEELNEVVRKMEENLGLQDSMAYFQRGIDLVNKCQSELEKSERKVRILVKKSNCFELEEFDVE